MKKLPLGIQSFKKLVEGEYLYVDKTRYIHDLINGASCYFLSRPRRFGKSLLLDTIGEAFGGDKELFKGLWIYDSGYDFPKHPVIRLDMSGTSNETPDILKTSILSHLEMRYRSEGFEFKDSIASDAFRNLILLLHEKYSTGVVVLIDEYDKPILDHITDVKTAAEIRKVLSGFYGILKSMDPCLRFTFITGVSKFTKTSIFSGLNNLTDITMSKKFAGICGVAIEDLGKYFGKHIERLSADEDFRQYGNLYNEILSWYDGYTWDGKTRVINPFSLLNFLEHERFSAFWYSSGTPTFLLDLIKSKPESYINISNTRISEDMLDSVNIEKITVEPLLFQTGYLTVKGVEHALGDLLYLMEMPNREVRRAFNLHILSALADSDDVRTGQMRLDVSAALRSGDMQKLLELLRRFFASIPYQLHVDAEAYYHSLFYAFMTVLGFDMQVEISVSTGRVDAIIELEDKVYVMEFKHENCPPEAGDEEKQKLYNKTLGEAMEQIREKGYSKKYAVSGKAIYEAAFAFIGRGGIEMAHRVL